MKTTFKTQIATAALVATLGLVSFNASAENGDNRNKPNKKEYKYENKNKADNRNYHADRNERYVNNNRGHYNYERNESRNQSYRYQQNNRYNDERYAYRHPKYGNVYRNFHNTPMRLHCSNGDFYYNSGYYYRYQPRVGYVRVSTPADYVFVDLPGNYTRVYVDGGWYYRSGDLYFERCAHGYRLSPHFSINFSARF